MDYQNVPIKRQPLEPEKSPLSDIAFVIAIIGLFCTPVPIFGFFGPALAVILANMGRGYRMSFAGKGKAAFIIGIIGIVIAALLFVGEVYIYLTSVLPSVDYDFEQLLNQYMNQILDESTMY